MYAYKAVVVQLLQVIHGTCELISWAGSGIAFQCPSVSMHLHPSYCTEMDVWFAHPELVLIDIIGAPVSVLLNVYLVG